MSGDSVASTKPTKAADSYNNTLTTRTHDVICTDLCSGVQEMKPVEICLIDAQQLCL